jgi:predicted amino acid dehydrogenase
MLGIRRLEERSAELCAEERIRGLFHLYVGEGARAIAALAAAAGAERSRMTKPDPACFAFVIHPLTVDDIWRHPALRLARRLPGRAVEWASARLPPLHLSRITGIRSELTGRSALGELYSLGATPREMLRLPPRHTYDQLVTVCRRAAERGARILGLGAFTSIVGDAGVTVAREAPIAVTSGNSLTVAMTLEAAKVAVRRMGHADLTRGRAMIVGATGSIGTVCARLLARAVGEVVLVSIEPERLRQLASLIESETPGARVTTALDTRDALAECGLVVSATSAFGQRVVDLAHCAPGAVVCDVARPFDVAPEEAALRPDVLVIEAGEVLLPGAPRFGFDIGLPAGVAYACLAETALLALAGRFESYTLGRDLDAEKVKEIYRLGNRHGLRLAGLRSFGAWVGEEEIAGKRALAERLRGDASLLAATREKAADRLSRLRPRSKGLAGPLPAPPSATP